MLIQNTLRTLAFFYIVVMSHTKHKKIMPQVGRLMPLLHLYDNFFTLTKLFCKEQRQDALTPILLVGMAAFRYLAHVIFRREQSLL